MHCTDGIPWRTAAYAAARTTVGITVLFMSFSVATHAADCSSFEITLTSQAAVDDFQADFGPCDHVVNSLTIEGPDIVNLSGISGLISTGDDLRIFNCPNLVNLQGLDALVTVGRFLEISGNTSLASLSGMNAFSFADGVAVQDNPALTNLADLSHLTSLDQDLHIKNNASLAFIDGVSNIANIGNDLLIQANPKLRRLTLLQLMDVGADVRVLDNAILSDVSDLANLKSVGNDIFVMGNPLLGRCIPLHTLFDDADDGLAGPGPGPGGIPDVGSRVFLGDNLPGCNSLEEALTVLDDGFETSACPCWQPEDIAMLPVADGGVECQVDGGRLDLIQTTGCDEHSFSTAYSESGYICYANRVGCDGPSDVFLELEIDNVEFTACNLQIRHRCSELELDLAEYP